MSYLQFQPGETIFQEGEVGTTAFIIDSGSVEIFVDRDGAELLISTISQGELFGEMAVIDAAPRSASARAKTTLTLIAITRDQINQHLTKGDSLVNLLLKVILRRYRASLANFQADSPSKRIQPELSRNDQTTGEYTTRTEPAEAAITSIRLEVEIRNGIANNEFRVFYQPIVDLQSGAIAGFEALVRWLHPSRGLLSPFHFVAVAEQTGLIVDLGAYVLEQACTDLPKLCNPCDNKSPFVAINVSPKQVNHPGFLDTIRDILDQTKAPVGQVKLEITESLFMDNPEVATNWINTCKEMGLTLALDDFGTGFSSLGYLYQFDLDNLKIDRCFITAMSENSKAMKVVKAITGLAQGLKLTVVAEGIETKAQMLALQALGCHYGQGFGFSKPLSLDDICVKVSSISDWRSLPS